MREILFRGKRTVTGKWAYGYLVKRPSACYIGIHNPWAIIVPPKDPDDRGGEYWIDYETVGQYTGITDQHGTKIFEGDIVNHYHRGDRYSSKVVYNDHTGCFELWSNVVVGAYGEKATFKFLIAGCSDLHIVGNIYDNPELLKKGW